MAKRQGTNSVITILFSMNSEKTNAPRLRNAFIQVIEAHPFLKLKLKLLAMRDVVQYFVKEDPVNIPI
jgi:hypothetical protein